MDKLIDINGLQTYHDSIKERFLSSEEDPNKVLTWQSDKARWDSIYSILQLEDIVTYGVSWKPNVSDPHLTRVGNLNLHRTLPIQSGMKGCIFQPISGEVVYWLDDNDWRKIKRNEGYTPKKETISGMVEDGSYKQITFSAQGPVIEFLPLEGTVNRYSRNSYVTINGVLCEVYDNSFEPDPVNLYTFSAAVVNQEESIEITNGSFTIEEESCLNGYKGEVMVYIPEFYIRSWDEPDRREVRISMVKVDDTWEHQPALYIGAYRDTVYKGSSACGYFNRLPSNSAVSVANTDASCRGGNDDSTNDTNEDVFKRQLGKCRTKIPRPTFRTYTRNAGKEIMSYRQYKNILYWLYVIEYANFNSQEPFNTELTIEGFHQGGLGYGLTNVSNWRAYNASYPITPNGYTNELGNRAGTKLIEPGGPDPVGRVYAIRWRGLENPFGDVWHNVDGIIIDADADNHPNNMNYVYTTDDPSKYGDTVDDIANMVLSGLEVRTDGYIKEWDLGATAEIIPRLTDYNTTIYKCDYHWTGDKGTSLKALLLGGCANVGSPSSSPAGLGIFDSIADVVAFTATTSFRSVYVVH